MAYGYTFNPYTRRLDAVGAVGPQGPQGVPGTTLTLTAGETLGGGRVVAIAASGQAVHADHANPDHAHQVVGITLGAVNPGDPATVQTWGELVEPAWSWTTGQPVFLGTTGQLTQTAPTSGFLKVMGFPITATRLLIQPQPSTTLI